MTYRDILVQVDETPASALRAAMAAQLAAHFKAHLTGVFLTSELPRDMWVGESIALFPAASINQLLADHSQAVAMAADEAHRQFQAIALKAGVQPDWLKVRGDDPHALYACARRADLVVFPKSAKVCRLDYEISAAQIGLACGGPVLVAPDVIDSPAPPKRILVAWNGSREAARALRDAWPMIAQADEVHVMVISPNGEGGPDGMLQRHFERHGCKANIIVDRSADGSAAEILEREVAKLGADLVVMGLYGRPRFQELVLGGVSRRMLHDLPVPVLASH